MKNKTVFKNLTKISYLSNFDKKILEMYSFINEFISENLILSEKILEIF